ncbi:hypothetical protein MPSEU_000409000 [Mayamaea pseudoterrestris]|nr:hypothetical protein MPSEU_000409000 [Mayamaea pseudoterrestris]
MPNQYEQLKEYTICVVDTGDYGQIKRLQPQDATTNPSLIYKAAQMEDYADLVQDAIKYGKGDVGRVMDKLAVNFGTEITKIVPGYVSTEVDARLSFDTEGTIKKARALIDMYKEVGVDKSRILIKIAATWEGVQAAKVLEKEGITCNLTLVFSLAQAIACADANATLISPFVGRIFDYYKKAQNVDSFKPEEDPGVLSVQSIYNYYKKFGYTTIVMGASFRNVGQIIELAGCDRLTMSPDLVDKLIASEDKIEKKLDASKAALMDIEKIDMDEKMFRWMMNEDPMATEKLADGIRNFAADFCKLQEIVKKKM